VLRILAVAVAGSLVAVGCTNDYGAFILDGAGAGSATGGSATGGSATGGSAIGGSATGGSATGGSAGGGAGGLGGGGGAGGLGGGGGAGGLGGQGGGGAGGLGGQGGAGPLWPLDPWGYRKKITLQSSLISAPGNGALTGFPVLISRADDDIAAAAQSNGDDLRFTAADGSTLLDYELEVYQMNGRFVAWVNIPSLSSTVDTEIYVYYGNPAVATQSNGPGVWVGDHQAVMHLHQNPALGGADEILDASGQGNDGTAEASMTPGDLIDAQIFRGFDLDGNDDFINFNAMDFGNQFTISAWLQPNPPVNVNIILANADGADNANGFVFLVNNPDTTDRRLIFATNIGSGWIAAQSGLNVVQDNQWNHVAVTVDRAAGQASFYRNGSDVTETQGVHTDFEVNSDFEVGRLEDAIFPFDGALDEVRISTVLRSLEWIATSYQNQQNPPAFHVVGMEEQKP